MACVKRLKPVIVEEAKARGLVIGKKTKAQLCAELGGAAATMKITPEKEMIEREVYNKMVQDANSRIKECSKALGEANEKTMKTLNTQITELQATKNKVDELVGIIDQQKSLIEGQRKDNNDLVELVEKQKKMIEKINARTQELNMEKGVCELALKDARTHSKKEDSSDDEDDDWVIEKAKQYVYNKDTREWTDWVPKEKEENDKEEVPKEKEEDDKEGGGLGIGEGISGGMAAAVAWMMFGPEFVI